MMKIIGYILVLIGFIGVFVFVGIGADQVHFFSKALNELPQAKMIEKDLAITQMASLDRSWRQMCHNAELPSFLMLFGSLLVGFGSKSKTKTEPQQKL